MRFIITTAVAALLFAALAHGGDNFASVDTRITAEKLGLPKGNARTSEPFVTRIYKTDDDGKRLDNQPDGYPFTITQDYILKDKEEAHVHEGVDLQSRPSPNEAPKPLEVKAGVYGVVLRAGDGQYGMIAVEVADGSVLEFLHTSLSYVKVGDVVEPSTVLGLTGKKGAGAIHLHVQAKSKSRKPLSPDLVFRVGQRKLKTPVKPEDKWEDYDPEESSVFQPKVIDGKKVPVKQLPETKWVVEVIGGGGKVDAVLGEFWTYSDASACSLAWSQANPDDLRLTREREVKVADGK
jgi:murein DD-endopeptidase MepM/ murein hydrolase activator NlpD